MACRSDKHIDLGVLGEQLCEVAYEVSPAFPGSPEQPREPKSVEVVSVRWLCELLPYMSAEKVRELEEELALEEA